MGERDFTVFRRSPLLCVLSGSFAVRRHCRSGKDGVRMTPQNLQKELLLTHAQMIRFFGERQVRPQICSMKRMTDALPEVHRQMLDAAFAESLRLLIDPSRGIVDGMIDREKLEQTHHRFDRMIDADTGYKAMAALDREAARLQRGALSLAALEGAGLGTLGIGCPEAAVLTALMLRSIFETAVLYGMNISHPWERELMLMLLAAAFVRGEDACAQQRQLAAVLRRLGEGEPPEIDREHRIRLAGERMSESMSLQKFIQGIPVLGVSGMFFNTAAAVRLHTLSRYVYRERYLSAKLRAAKRHIAKHNGLKPDTKSKRQ